ncbi:MAG: efflux RND transporter periplasmic adaptor subunit [Chlamydiales bacterium]
MAEKTQKKGVVIGLIVLLVFLVGGLYLFKRIQHHRDDRFITLYGNVDIRQVDLGFRVFGKVKELFVDEGDPVEPGQLLALMDAEPYQDQLQQAEGQKLKAQSELENARQLYQRRIGLSATGSISEENFEDIENRRNSALGSLKQAEGAVQSQELNIADTHLYSPTTGTILSRIREPGSVLQPGEAVFVISIASPVWVRAYVSEPDLGIVVPGMRAKIMTDTPSLPVYEGHVGFISPTAEFTPKNVQTADLRTDLVYRIRVIVDNPDDNLRQGMPVTVKLEKPQPKENHGD